MVLSAQALESVRILLNSANRQYPNGLANSSGALGHYLMDHVMGGGAVGEFPELAVKPSLNGPHRPSRLVCGALSQCARSAVQEVPPRLWLPGDAAIRTSTSIAPGFGEAYKKSVLDPITTVSLGGFGESLGRWENYVEIDPSVRDTFGIPVLRMHMTYGENERAMVQDMADSAAEMLEAAGAKNIRPHAKAKHSRLGDS